jgi:hypothetical protein
MSHGNPLRCLTFSEPKRGCGRAEYEDAFASDLGARRFAVADGATESAFAGLWARALVDGFVAAPHGDRCGWDGWVETAQARWQREVNHQELPWYAEIQWQQGAFATFLGLTVGPSGWRALAVGDSCLCHVRGNRVCEFFPLRRSAEFTASPWLLGSRDCGPEALATRELRTGGDFQGGDRLWLMTDALAHWFLRSAEAGHRPWELLEPLLDTAAPRVSFTAWIAALRDGLQIRNDDVTLMAVWA